MSRKLNNLDQIRQRAENSLFYFMEAVNPSYRYGDIHKEACDWITREGRRHNQMIILPRGHLKSHILANFTAWLLTRNPTTTIMYLSATATLAELQLFAIKSILTSEFYTMLWPDMVNPKEAQRTKWNNSDIIVDHPLRKKSGVRDSSVSCGGVTKTITGLHADEIILDDMVVPENAYTVQGRDGVKAIYSQLASIKNPNCSTTVAGTPYHPKDIYVDLEAMEYNLMDDETGEVLGIEKMYDVISYPVEEDNVFLWPRKMDADGKFYGFNHSVLQKIYAEYIDKTQFYAQYYLKRANPEERKNIKFQYYDKKFIDYNHGNWYFNGKKLSIYSAGDLAYSEGERSDHSAIVVVGVDGDNNVYVLDIERFKSKSIAVYYQRIYDLHMRWKFSRIRLEVNAAQGSIVNELRREYIAKNGLALSIDDSKPNRHMGNKEERIDAIILHRYENGSIWHYKGGNCHLLEDEVLGTGHSDDIKDALASAVEVAKAPTMSTFRKKESNISYHPRFGGVT